MSVCGAYTNKLHQTFRPIRWTCFYWTPFWGPALVIYDRLLRKISLLNQFSSGGIQFILTILRLQRARGKVNRCCFLKRVFQLPFTPQGTLWPRRVSSRRIRVFAIFFICVFNCFYSVTLSRLCALLKERILHHSVSMGPLLILGPQAELWQVWPRRLAIVEAVLFYSFVNLHAPYCSSRREFLSHVEWCWPIGTSFSINLHVISLRWTASWVWFVEVAEEARVRRWQEHWHSVKKPGRSFKKLPPTFRYQA